MTMFSVFPYRRVSPQPVQTEHRCRVCSLPVDGVVYGTPEGAKVYHHACYQAHQREVPGFGLPTDHIPDRV